VSLVPPGLLLLLISLAVAFSTSEIEETALWCELGVSSWSEVEDSDVDDPRVKRLLELQDK
jgi:hypothetical protein